MNLDPDLLQRCYHWIEDSPGAGHAYHCAVRNMPPEHIREHKMSCNCGRDKLFADLTAAMHTDFRSTNGGAHL